MTETQTPASKLPGEYEFEFTEWPFFWLAKSDRAYHAILEGAMAKRGLGERKAAIERIARGAAVA